MSGEKVCLLIAIVGFAIGAIAPAIPPGTPRAINWLCFGWCFAAAAFFVAGGH
jgi:hypothetical protein